MNLKMIAISLLAFSWCSATYADNYTPPERVQCTLTDAGKLSCGSFSRQYLTEDTFTADLQKDKEEVFNFVSGLAQFTLDQKQATVSYTYGNMLFQEVKLKTISPLFGPVSNGAWQKVRENVYMCTASYMQCGITNLS